MIISFQVDATAIPASASGGRIVIELSSVLFDNDLNLGLSNNDPVAC